ncbi:MAG: prepilin-type N-terminal cleavage/methylation domain-containing protein [Planctomycetota bacterium]
MRADRGFTVIEIIVVIVIILVLAAILVPVIMAARVRSRRAECTNNMRQIHLALQMFRDDNISQGRELNPNWLNSLIWDPPGADENDPIPENRPKPLMNPQLLICPLDGSKGKQGGKPDMAGVDQYAELDEYAWFSDPSRFNVPHVGLAGVCDASRGGSAEFRPGCLRRPRRRHERQRSHQVGRGQDGSAAVR